MSEHPEHVAPPEFHNPPHAAINTWPLTGPFEAEGPFVRLVLCRTVLQTFIFLFFREDVYRTGS